MRIDSSVRRDVTPRGSGRGDDVERVTGEKRRRPRPSRDVTYRLPRIANPLRIMAGEEGRRNAFQGYLFS